jgi:hypothetical protein
MVEQKEDVSGVITITILRWNPSFIFSIRLEKCGYVIKFGGPGHI